VINTMQSYAGSLFATELRQLPFMVSEMPHTNICIHGLAGLFKVNLG